MPKLVNITYDQQKNIIFVEANEEDFDPQYFKYLMEYLNIPADAEKRFLGTPIHSSNE